MERHRKLAVFNLGVGLRTGFLFLCLIPMLGPRRAQGAFGTLGLLAFGQLFYRRKQPDEVLDDERDCEVMRRAGKVSFAIFWIYFVGALTTVSLFYGGRGFVPVGVVELFGWLGWLVLLLVYSTAILIQYRRT